MDVLKITKDGLKITPHPVIKSALEDEYRKIHGSDINLNPNSPDGQLINIFSLFIYDISVQILNVINGFRVATAIGIQLDDIGEFLNQKRISYPKSIILRITSIKNIVLTNDYIYTYNDAKFSFDKGTAIKEGVSEYVLYAIQNATTENSITEIITPNAITRLTEIIPEKSESDIEYKKRLLNTRNYVNNSTYIGLQNLILRSANVNDVKIYDNPTLNTNQIGVPPKTIWIIVDTNDFEGIAHIIYKNLMPNTFMKGDIEVHVKNKYETKNIYFDLVKYLPIYIEIQVISAVQESASISELNKLKDVLISNLRFKIGVDLAVSEVFDIVNNANKTFRYTKIDLFVYRELKKVKANLNPNERYVLYNENITFKVQGLD